MHVLHEMRNVTYYSKQRVTTARPRVHFPYYSLEEAGHELLRRVQELDPQLQFPILCKRVMRLSDFASFKSDYQLHILFVL